ncbi:SGNH/GDSL hydrolase family protein [Cesiribacter andamanensis]|uniref:GDSL-like Lipase/Acylhydrolase n=1 Tax=Cesiribacter andamanensis AMV16 TaxID=1279009 RepID=M7NQE4_9BACT|nr:SGNH/GDSL hydrolase family protein [Cesiribacter andamanensis]EMR00729.1 GDSL-like Lipase/Acylhydrolase [Cesiribacter andamanensis AMV16]
MINYLALGDSYTIGEGVAPEERWPVLLQKRLQEQGIALSDPRIIATTGWTTAELLAAIEREQPTNTFDLVSLLIGVNNQYRGYDLDIFRTEFTKLVQKAIYFARKKPEGVVVVSIPDWGVTPFAADKGPERIAGEIEQYNRLKREICQRLDVRFYDITPLSKQAATDSGLLAEDQLHPSGRMYARWVETILPDVVKQCKLLKKV